MGTIVVKLKNEHYEKENDMKRLLSYIAGEGKNKKKEKLLQSGGKGVSLNPEKAARQMQAVQRAYGKECKRRTYQLIVSFPEEVREKEAVINAAGGIADMLFEDYQVFYGIHISKNNWHVHYAINAVSYMTGKKWHQNKEEFRKMKQQILGIAERYFF